MTQPFQNAEDALKFILAGNSTVTFAGAERNYTFKVSLPVDGRGEKEISDAPYFVGLLTGPDNQRDYQYIGFLPHNQPLNLVAGRKGNRNHPAFTAFNWVLRQLQAGKIPPPLEVWHEGRCGRCGRKLTVPESIETGFGPECAGRV